MNSAPRDVSRASAAGAVIATAPRLVPRVAVIILTMNQREKTLRCLRSFASVAAPEYAIVLWDNGSTDGTVDAVRAEFPSVLVHHSPANLGVAGGRNAAAALAIDALAPTHLFFLDNDTLVAPDALSALLQPMADPAIGQTAPKIRFIQDPTLLDEAGGSTIEFWLGRVRVAGHGQRDDGRFDTAHDCVAGGCTMVRTDVFQRLGGFDVCFNPYGPEDMDFSLRLRAAGLRSRYVPAAVIYHERTQTFEGGSYTQRFASRKARNWIILMRRHASPAAWLGFATVGMPLTVARAVLREGRRGNLGALRGWIGGAIESLRAAPRGTGL